eukprot:g15573.t1
MAREVLREAGGGKAAIISAPSVMNGIKLLKSDGWSCGTGGGATVYIFEYDRRFDQAYPESFNPECVGKFLETADAIARRPWASAAGGGDLDGKEGNEPVTPMMFITSPLNHAYLRENMGLRRTPFRLAFKSKFATPMSLYTNYLSDALGGWVEEEEE